MTLKDVYLGHYAFFNVYYFDSSALSGSSVVASFEVRVVFPTVFSQISLPAQGSQSSRERRTKSQANLIHCGRFVIKNPLPPPINLCFLYSPYQYSRHYGVFGALIRRDGYIDGKKVPKVFKKCQILERLFIIIGIN